jgi:hypothetical protein
MPEESPKGLKTQLALALAQGAKVSGWAHTNEVARRTAYRWASDPKVRRTVEAIRRRAIDRAVGLMAAHATSAAKGIVALAQSAQSESVQLSALRAILRDMMSVSRYTGLEARMNQIEEQIFERTGNADHAG